MKAYEGIFIFPPDATPEILKKQEKSLDDLIQKFAGTIANKTDFGKKTLGYEIKKHRDGHFFVYDFSMEPSKMVEYRKALNLHDGLLKFMLLVKPEKTGKIVKPKSTNVAEKTEAVAAPAHS
jgi:small subunit ribosomal protein S6